MSNVLFILVKHIKYVKIMLNIYKANEKNV